MINSFPPLSEKQKKHTIRFYRYLIVGATFAIPLNVHIANGLILSCLLPSIFLWDKKITPHILLIPIFLFFSLAFSLLWTENIKEGLSRMELQINLLLVPLVFYCGRNFIDEKLQKQVEIAFLGAMSIFLIGGYLRVHMDTGKWFFFRDTLESYDIHPGYTSVYVLMCFIILSKSNVNLFEFCLVTAFVFFILIVFSAKNQILTFLLLIALKLFLSKFNRVKITVFLTFSVALLIYSYQNINHIKNRFHETEETRIKFFTAAKTAVLNHPVFGVGLGDRQDYLDSLLGENAFPWEIGQNSHNQVLDYWISSGILSALFFLSLFVIPLRSLLSQEHFFFLLLTFSASLTESFFFRQAGLIFFLIFYCLFQARSTNPIRPHA